jgi:hypothetical protein
MGEGKVTSAALLGVRTLKGDNHTAASGKTSSSFLNEPLTPAFLLLIYSEVGVYCMFKSVI